MKEQPNKLCLTSFLIRKKTFEDVEKEPFNLLSDTITDLDLDLLAALTSKTI